MFISIIFFFLVLVTSFFYCSLRKLKIKSVYLIVMRELNQHIDQIKKLCTRNGVKSLFAFGSVTTDQFKPESDIDLIVDIENNDPLSYSDSYFRLKFELEQLLKRQIDLLEQKAIKNPFFKEEIEKTKVLIYA